MCSGSRRPEPGARERPSPGRRPRQHPRQETRSRGRRCPEPGVNGCAAAGRVNEARRRGRRRRRRRPRRRRCGDWDAPWSPTARSLWAGPETLPLPGAPPPPPTWFQCCAQAGPAGGREGGRTGGARGFTSQKLLQAPSSLMERSIVHQVTRVVHSSCRFVCHPCTAISSSTATTGKCITCQIPWCCSPLRNYHLLSFGMI
ncbi:uncharacterized protein LOC134810271 isoform X2 [Pan troglodytes]|uniref:uncharacterized protein LOC134810271 isoform X2 n=1 Tax=Pan troglodytes TaxID=9598 RepID=UPI0030134C95